MATQNPFANLDDGPPPLRRRGKRTLHAAMIATVVIACIGVALIAGMTMLVDFLPHRLASHPWWHKHVESRQVRLLLRRMTQEQNFVVFMEPSGKFYFYAGDFRLGDREQLIEWHGEDVRKVGLNPDICAIIYARQRVGERLSSTAAEDLLLEGLNRGPIYKAN